MINKALNLIRCILFCINTSIISMAPTTFSTMQELIEHGHQARIEGNYKTALEFLTQAYKQDPDNKALHYELCLAFLACEQFSEGFTLMHRVTYRPHFFVKPWHGQDCTNKVMLIDASWNGYGDIFMFIRYAQQLKLMGTKKIIVYSNPALQKLLELCPYIDKVVILSPALSCNNRYKESDIEECDYQCRFMSLPYFLQTTIDTIYTKPYLYANPGLSAAWKPHFPQDRLNIGLCWRGQERTDPQFKLRSMDIRNLIPLLKTTAYNFYCLDIEHTDDLKQLPSYCRLITFDNLDTHNGAFMDTAAIMKNLDVIITIDTSIAHLAGALGVPVWVMVPYSADWRYHLDRSDSPWYPTMRIFRQRHWGDWKYVVFQIKQALAELSKNMHKGL